MMQAELYCHTCNTSFQRREHYQRHIRTHTKERPFSCTDCGQSFSRVDSLARHYGTVHQRLEPKNGTLSTGEKRRVAQACRRCNQSKVRCDGQLPCQRCQNQKADCYYGPSQKRKLGNSSAVVDAQSAKRPHYAENLLGPILGDGSNGGAQLPVRVAPPTYATDAPQSIKHTPTLPPTIISPDDSAAVDARQPVHDMAYSRYGTRDFSPVDPGLGSLLGVGLGLQLDLDFNLDSNVWPQFVSGDPSFEHLNDLLPSASAFGTSHAGDQNPGLPTPRESMVADIYVNDCTPTSEAGSIEPRHYIPSADGIDSLIAFPDMHGVTEEEIDQENLAHVREISATELHNAFQLAEAMQDRPTYPPFLQLRLPPAPILNAWVQLYFEHFHPLFPLLHKPSFNKPGTHWLLILAVSAIGALFSKFPQAHSCARAMDELIRRQSHYLCENQNRNSRELWLTQAILLNSLSLRYSGERRALELAELFQAVPVTLGRRKQLFHCTVPPEKASRMDLPLDQRWQIWTLDEERRRTGLAIWLMDSAFQSHFDLTPILRLGEIQNTLPQTEDRWGAVSATGWARFPQACPNLGQVAVDDSWVRSWSRTGVFGKQAILQMLLNSIHAQRNLSSTGFPHAWINNDETCSHLEKLLLEIGKGDQVASALELRASIVHRITALSALMVAKSPNLPLLSSALKIKYRRCDDNELASLSATWKAKPLRARQTVYYAARLFESLKSDHCPHFSSPVVLFQSTLLLWIYSMLGEVAPDVGDRGQQAPTVVLGLSSESASEVGRQWIQSGHGRIKMPGIGSLLAPMGRVKLLDEAISGMKMLRCWGVSEIYTQILQRLRAD
ncbi:fungal-specific transcription factor domain-containing protein [Aspergillus karnatakaensis]|uniref:transcription factor domain-containing protein n=1 Tax=Aspergillus karnatakaensis TaxID=1810916 RepID=UPI003CCDC6A1